MGKTIVITGAGDGLGRALARRFARDGDTVVLLGRTLAKVEAVAAELGAPAVAIACDVANPDSVRTAFAEVARRYPRIDVLINNAGVYWPFTLPEATDQLVQDIVGINLSGPIFCAREALPLLRGGGLVINVTSESSVLKTPMLWLYAATKHAVELMSDMWARELEAEGVRVTVVRAGQMFDETKTGAPWPIEVSMRFGAAAAQVGINLREKGTSHYNSVTDAFRAILDMPADMHLNLVSINGRKP
ncbi:SDR family oxidoreductase [Novosphingobium piscinae]|uniref:SDR family oxidoreductase n=1 Tax=Novosphingobium piscinae TaxID=1507448 RepID=A0A7X1KNR8_9SPHN|nr:SDR family oxidoreductase [Novosphingobium piscinae]MBC2667723.1 SDR family oxidoreductase [Novosphingobium piscinae]